MYFQYNKNLINFPVKNIISLQTEARNKLLNLEYEFFVENFKKQEFLKKKRTKEFFLYELIQYKLFLKKRKLKRRKLLNQLTLESKKHNQDLSNQENKEKSILKQYGDILYPKFNSLIP